MAYVNAIVSDAYTVNKLRDAGRRQNNVGLLLERLCRGF